MGRWDQVNPIERLIGAGALAPLCGRLDRGFDVTAVGVEQASRVGLVKAATDLGGRGPKWRIDSGRNRPAFAVRFRVPWRKIMLWDGT